MFQDSEIILREKFFSDFQTNRVLVSQCDSKGRNSPLHVIKEGRLSLFGSHGKGTGPRVSHCDAGVPVKVKNFGARYPFWGRRSVGQNFVGLDITGAKFLGQNIVGQEVSGAGRRGAKLRGAGRHWGNIPGAVGQ